MKHAIPFLTTIFITTIGLCSINAQGKGKSANGLTAKTEVLAFHIANVNEVHGPAIGFAGTKSKQFERFEELSRHASISELVTLTGHGNAAVRVYAYWALESKNYNGLATIKPKMKDELKRICESKLNITTTNKERPCEITRPFLIQLLKRYL